ncbi:MAG: S41 family peptidase [Acidobacteriota bacterium]
MKKLMTHAVLLLSVGVTARAEPMRSGIWKSVGYAEVLVVGDGQYTFYDVTRATCVEREHGVINPTEPYFPSVTYPSAEKMVVEGSSYRYSLLKMDTLPEACTVKRQPPDALETFDAFWSYLDENYAGFKARGIDWHAVRTRYRPRVTTTTTESELYATLGEIVAMINDPHVFVSNRKQGVGAVLLSARDLHGIARVVAVAQPGHEDSFYHRASHRIEEGIEALIRYEVLGGRFKTAFNDKLTWGMLDPNVAYLRASAFVGLFTGMKRDDMLPALEAKLDEAFGDFKDARALVIDVSTNTGGAGFIPAAIARRIIREPKVAWTKRARANGGLSEDVFTMRIEPSVSTRFTGPVVILMSNNSVSSGEELPLILKGLPYVTLFGDTSPGALSDIQMKSLPNGGVLGLPNEVVMSADGENYDARGIAPDVRTSVFDPAKPLSGYTRTLAAAASLAARMALR